MVLAGWSEIPIQARRLILYYTISAVPLTMYVFFPIYMYMLGFSLELVALLFTLNYALIAVSKYLVGRLLDIRVSPKHCLMLIDFLGAVESFIYSFAREPIHFIIAFVIESASAPLGVAYRAIEKDLYPSDKLELVYRHHMFWPYISELVSTLVLGLIIGLAKDFLYMIRVLFLVIVIMNLILVLFVYKYIPSTTSLIRMRTRKKEEKRKLFTRQLTYLVVAELLIIFAYFLTPGFILQNYLFNILGLSIVTITIIEVFDAASRGSASILHEKIEKIGQFKVLVASLIISSLAGLLMFISQYIKSLIYLVVIIIIATVIISVGESLWWLQHEAILMKRVPGERRGELFGTVSAIRSILNIVTPLVTAYIASRIHPLAPYLAYMFLLICAIPLYYFALSVKN